MRTGGTEVAPGTALRRRGRNGRASTSRSRDIHPSTAASRRRARGRKRRSLPESPVTRCSRCEWRSAGVWSPTRAADPSDRPPGIGDPADHRQPHRRGEHPSAGRARARAPPSPPPRRRSAPADEPGAPTPGRGYRAAAGEDLARPPERRPQRAESGRGRGAAGQTSSAQPSQRRPRPRSPPRSSTIGTARSAAPGTRRRSRTPRRRSSGRRRGRRADGTGRVGRSRPPRGSVTGTGSRSRPRARSGSGAPRATRSSDRDHGRLKIPKVSAAVATATASGTTSAAHRTRRRAPAPSQPAPPRAGGEDQPLTRVRAASNTTGSPVTLYGCRPSTGMRVGDRPADLGDHRGLRGRRELGSRARLDQRCICGGEDGRESRSWLRRPEANTSRSARRGVRRRRRAGEAGRVQHRVSVAAKR